MEAGGIHPEQPRQRIYDCGIPDEAERANDGEANKLHKQRPPLRTQQLEKRRQPVEKDGLHARR
jgi:hypothetical protein